MRAKLSALLLVAAGVGAAAYVVFSRPLSPVMPEGVALSEALPPLAVGDQALQQGDWRTAEAAYSAVATADPPSARAEMGWARARS